MHQEQVLIKCISNTIPIVLVVLEQRYRSPIALQGIHHQEQYFNSIAISYSIDKVCRSRKLVGRTKC